ncbi:hypothetical protein PR048_030394, partial [Dryococelus australis]
MGISLREIFPFMLRVSNISHQYEEISQLKKNILQNEVLVHVDFCENHTCKYSKEIQSAHFGGSKPQLMGGYLSEKLNMEEIHWHFSESAHGKGAPDAVRAALKRTVDGLVAYQVDIPDCDMLVPLLQQHCKGITVKQVQEPVITSIEKYIPKNIPVVKGTMKIHEV